MMMRQTQTVLSHLPKHLIISTQILFFTPSSLPSPKPIKNPSFPTSKHPSFPLFSSLFSTLSTTQTPLKPILTNDHDEDTSDDDDDVSDDHDDEAYDDEEEEDIVGEKPKINMPIEKLFIPPDVEIDVETYNDSSKNSNVRILKGSNIVLSKYAKNALIVKAEFVKSSVKTEECPNEGFPEFALVGRSNVGKSSLLNSIVRRKKLALTSKKPGKTQCINHFRINDSWYLVDLPGYGFAEAPKDVRKDWDTFTKSYFINRQTLVSVFLLIDASIPAKKIDLEYASWLGRHKVPMTLVFTKCDKRKKKKNGGKRAEENVEDFLNLIREYFDTAPPWIMTSSVTNLGRDEVLLHMAQLRNYWLKN